MVLNVQLLRQTTSAEEEKAGAGTGLQVHANRKATFLDGQWQCSGARAGNPVWRHTERALQMYNADVAHGFLHAGRFYVPREAY